MFSNLNKGAILTIVAIFLVVCIAIGGYIYYQNTKLPVITEVKELTSPNVKTALDSAGFKVTGKEADEIVKETKHRVASGPADYQQSGVTEKQADQKAKEVAKEDSADTVLKEKKPDPKDPNKTDMYYYGIHLEKKHGYGVYADLTKEGSMGIHIRNDRVIVQVGQKYTDKSITARVAYEVIQY